MIRTGEGSREKDRKTTSNVGEEETILAGLHSAPPRASSHPPAMQSSNLGEQKTLGPEDVVSPTTLAGSEGERYEIIRFLGQGGMGTVYLARIVAAVARNIVPRGTHAVAIELSN